jgi:heme-degrading monooxygenase HmoA
MFLRLVQAKIRPDDATRLGEAYREGIMPALESTRGCLFAGLAQSTQRREEVISLTLWTSRDDAAAYERSGKFMELLAIARPFFSDSTEWRLHLTDDLRLEYGPVPNEPVVVSFDDVPAVQAPPIPEAKDAAYFVRIVFMTVHPGRRSEFVRTYMSQVVPGLKAVRGCRFMQLAQSMENSDEFISFTVWDSRRDAEAYEESGQFAALRDLLRPTLSSLYQWKMDQEAEGGALAHTSEDTTVRAYQFLVGKSFRK